MTVILFQWDLKTYKSTSQSSQKIKLKYIYFVVKIFEISACEGSSKRYGKIPIMNKLCIDLKSFLNIDLSNFLWSFWSIFLYRLMDPELASIATSESYL